MCCVCAGVAHLGSNKRGTGVSEMTQASVIKSKNLDLTFQTNDGPVQALRDVSLDIGKGEFVSFIGPSGCGKTTFLRVIAGLKQPTGGAISVNGMTPDEARQARAYGYVFQAAGLYPWRTIAGNVRLPLEITRKKVVFPQPLGPIKLTNSPLPISSDTLRSACTGLLLV